MLRLTSATCDWMTSGLIVDAEHAPWQWLVVARLRSCCSNKLIPYESGTATVKGEPIHSPRPDIGVVFQTNNMLPWFTVRKNVELGARIRKMPAQARDQAVDKVLEVLSLSKFAEAYPHELSGGMRQRASIGQARCSIRRSCSWTSPSARSMR